ncbi:MAG: hypothetical protein CMF56_00445 [Leifsonia sp.]|mgnify:CR=1 FL=1|nr:hypothetical protein [Leifsonia sp.]
MAVNKTGVTEVDPREFIASLEHPRQRAESELLLELMAEVTGEPPRMWGPTMVGFGAVHYRYESGHEGDAFVIGFAPRRGKFALYGFTEWEGASDLLARLGKHQQNVSCVYVNKLDDVDREVLRDAVQAAWAANGGWSGVAPS